jgi:transcriptional regulator with XRE-family HTH domain
MELINKNIRYIRKQLGLTQDKMSYQLGITRPALGSYEEGRAVPKWNVICNLADISGISTDELMKKDLLEESREISTEFLDRMDDWQPRTDERFQPSTATFIAKEKENIAEKTATMAEKKAATLLAIQQQEQQESNKTDKNHYAKASLTTAPPAAKKNNTLQTISLLLDETEQPIVSFISSNAQKNYLQNINTPDFLVKQPRLQLPFTEAGQLYRAFETPENALLALQKGTIVVAKYVRNWLQIRTEKPYIIVTPNEIICRFVQNELAENNALRLLPEGNALKEKLIVADQILEIWEAQWFIHNQLPSPQLPQNELTNIVLQLQQEVIKLKGKI